MIVLFLLILGLSIPFSIRTTLLSFSIQGEVSPFLTEYLYVSDLIIGILLALYLIKNSRRFRTLISTWWVYLLVLIWCLGVWTSTYPLLAFLFGLRMGALALIGKILLTYKDIYWMVYGFMIGMVLQGGIAGYQVVSQSSLDIPLIIEPTLGPDIAGIAKIDMAGNTFVRAHGTFPHANILGFASFFVLMIMNSSYISHQLWRWILIGSVGVMSFFDHFFFTFTQGILLAWVSMLLTLSPIDIILSRRIKKGISLLAILLIISSGSFVVMGLTGIFLIIQFLPETWVSWMIPRTKMHLGLGVVCIGSISTIIIQLFSFLATAQNRLFFLGQSWHILQDHPLGVGWGQFVQGLNADAFEVWQYQPVHNVFLLILVEGGWIVGSLGVVLIIYWLYSCLYVSSQN